jgi:hypothetical protein
MKLCWFSSRISRLLSNFKRSVSLCTVALRNSTFDEKNSAASLLMFAGDEAFRLCRGAVTPFCELGLTFFSTTVEADLSFFAG